MNEFTKEELFKIRQAVIATSFKPWLVPMIESGEANFIEKIERMINNYSDHESNETEELIQEAFCCGQKWHFANVNWSIAKCHQCGKNLRATQ